VESDEKPCPWCGRVHYSSYNAERCAARHDGISQMPGHKHMKNKQKSLSSGNENGQSHHNGNPAVPNGSPAEPAPVQK